MLYWDNFRTCLDFRQTVNLQHFKVLAEVVLSFSEFSVRYYRRSLWVHRGMRMPIRIVMSLGGVNERSLIGNSLGRGVVIRCEVLGSFSSCDTNTVNTGILSDDILHRRVRLFKSHAIFNTILKEHPLYHVCLNNN